MTAGPLTLRRLAFPDDGYKSSEWTPSQRARFIDAARRASARRDRAIVEQGQQMLAEYRTDDGTTPDAFRSFMADLLSEPHR
jgi:uncharacterized damage-inducible protein DinB